MSPVFGYCFIYLWWVEGLPLFRREHSSCSHFITFFCSFPFSLSWKVIFAVDRLSIDSFSLQESVDSVIERLGRENQRGNIEYFDTRPLVDDGKNQGPKGALLCHRVVCFLHPCLPSLFFPSFFSVFPLVCEFLICSFFIFLCIFCFLVLFTIFHGLQSFLSCLLLFEICFFFFFCWFNYVDVVTNWFSFPVDLNCRILRVLVLSLHSLSSIHS